jgi:hypothetical protein
VNSTSALDSYANGIRSSLLSDVIQQLGRKVPKRSIPFREYSLSVLDTENFSLQEETYI